MGSNPATPTITAHLVGLVMRQSDYILYAVVIFGWSTSWLALKWQLGVVAPEVSLLWRFLMSAALMTIITIARGYSMRVGLKDHLKFIGMGLCLFSMNFNFFYYGGLNATSGLLAVVFSTASLINIFLVAVLTRTKPSILMVMAAMMGFIGVGLIFSPQLGDSGLVSLILCLIGTLFFCSGNIISSSSQKDHIPVMTANSWGMFYGAVILGGISMIRGHEFIIEMTPRYIGSLLWLALISSVMTFTAYLLLVGRIGSGKAGYATAIFPIGALLISTIFEEYQWGLMAILGLALVVGGNIVMLRAK